MIFQIWKTTYTRDQAESYAARDHHEAAMIWAQEYDRRVSSGAIAAGAQLPDIFVANGDVVRKFRVRGRLDPVYSAVEVTR